MSGFVNMLTVSKARAAFSGIARKVVRSKKPVIVRVPNGSIQIAPYELPEEVAPFPAGSLKLLPRGLATFGSGKAGRDGCDHQGQRHRDVGERHSSNRGDSWNLASPVGKTP